MRRLLALVSTIVFVDTMLYAALTPLLPHFTHELGLSKSRAGVLVAAYAAGALIGGLPGGIATARLGVRRALLIGFTSMGLAGIGFGLAGSFWSLFAARLIQGAGSGFTWAGALAWLIAAVPRERRGAALGTALSAAVFGALFGPVVGAAAAAAGRAVVFSSLAGLALVLAIWTVQLEAATPEEEISGAALMRSLRNRRFLGGLTLMALASFLFGIIGVLGPLHLSRAGWGATAIGGVWLSAAALEGVEAPFVGRLSDRRGNLLPVRVALVASAAASLGLAAGARPLVYVPLILLAEAAYGVLFTPSFALIAAGADRVGLAQGMAFGLMNGAWALGAVVGPAAGGGIASATGDSIPFVLAAAVCIGALAATRRSPQRQAAVMVERGSGDPARARRR